MVGVLFLCALFLLVFSTVAVGHPTEGDPAGAVTAAIDVADPTDPPPPGAVAAALEVTDPSYLPPASTGRGPATPPENPDSPSSIGGSALQISTGNCYEAGTTSTLCFTVYNGSTDSEWLDQVRLTFPTILGPWTVACNAQDTTDSSGNLVGLTCNTSGNEVYYSDTDIETPTSMGEVTPGASWLICVDVTVPGGYTGPRYVQWGLSGDEEPGSALPHDVSGSTEIEMCTPLML